ncbi:MAG: hypothetical protein J6Y25_03580 [Elusimicrobiaceae bacterium]|nr:hypothetical protein [Elusimicrobiaceae bacterium]MBP5616600.1 hypothetical protein [Elusimicrobiaceae bacterium]
MKKLAVLLVAVLMAAPAFAGDKGILKLSLWGDAAVAVPNNIHTVRGIDLGIGSTTDSLYGFQWNLLFGEVGELRGINEALAVAKVNEGYGINSAWIYARTNHFYGAQGAIVSINDSFFGGLQAGLINLSHGKVIGAQFGFYNQVADLHGVQLGFVNYAQHISKGLQIGLVNIAKNGWLPAMIIVNGRF